MGAIRSNARPRVRSAMVHTHGKGSNKFSGYEGDMAVANDYKVPLYLINPVWDFLVFNRLRYGVRKGVEPLGKVANSAR